MEEGKPHSCKHAKDSKTPSQFLLRKGACGGSCNLFDPEQMLFSGRKRANDDLDYFCCYVKVGAEILGLLLNRIHCIIDPRAHVYNGGTCCFNACLLYTSDAADDLLCVDLGGRR